MGVLKHGSEQPVPSSVEGARRGRWREFARGAKRRIAAVRLAAADPRTPWPLKALAAGLVAYALSPIDLIPDFIPVLGLLNDLVVLPLGLLLLIRLLPPGVWSDALEQSTTGSDASAPAGSAAAPEHPATAELRGQARRGQQPSGSDRRGR